MWIIFSFTIYILIVLIGIFLSGYFSEKLKDPPFNIDNTEAIILSVIWPLTILTVVIMCIIILLENLFELGRKIQRKKIK